MEGVAMTVPAGLDRLRGKRFLVTGHTGFKGSWLLLLLDRLGARVTGYALAPATTPALFTAARLVDLLQSHVEADIRDTARLTAVVRAAEPDVVIHLAAQSLVRHSYREPLETFSSNVIGTASLLDAVRKAGRPCALIVATSDKCYEPHAGGRPHQETDRLGGDDPYSASKGAAEIVAAAYRRSFFPPARLRHHGVQLATVRAGNVIGGGDWAADRIVTDMVRHLSVGQAVPLRNPLAVRPWQHVLEPLAGYLALADAMLAQPREEWCAGWNFGPAAGSDMTVQRLAETFIAAWGGGQWEHLQDREAPLETDVLRLAIEKSLANLSWMPRLSPVVAIQRTAAWFRAFEANPTAARSLCTADIEFYERSGGDTVATSQERGHG